MSEKPSKVSSPFVIQCSREVFSDAEIEILESHGTRLQRLADGRQSPVRKAGRRFVEVVNGRREPETVYERTWVKYLQRLEWERDPANQAAMGPRRKVRDDRPDWKHADAATRGDMIRRARALDD